MSKWIKSLRTALSQIDLYSEEITLLYENQRAYSHPSGQFFSLALITLTIFSFISLTLEMYALNSPNVVTSIESDPNPAVQEQYNFKQFQVSPENFLFAFGIADYDGVPLINTENKVWWTTEFQVCGQKTIINKDGIPKVIIDCTFIPMVSCADTLQYPQLYEGLSLQRLSLFQCPNTTIWNEVINQTVLYGLPSSDDFSFISFRYFLCNSSAQSNCVSDQEISERLPYGFVQSIFTDRLMDQKKSANPYNTVIKTTTTAITPQQQAYIKNTLRHSQSDSITNFFYYVPTQTVYRTLTLSNQIEQLLQTPDSLYQMVFMMDDRKENFTRTYQTFFDILGNIGGLQSFFSIVLSFIIGPLTKKSQRLALINQVFQFENNDKNKSQQIDFNILSNQNPGCEYNQGADALQLKESDLRKIRIQQDKKLGLKWWQHLLTPSEKKAQFLQGVKIFEQQLDVTNIINKLFELEKLKQLILDEDQYRLFEYLPKPTISPKASKFGSVCPQMQRGIKAYDWFVKDENIEFKFVKACDSYKRLKNLQDTRTKKLLQMLDHEARSDFEIFGDHEQISLKDQNSLLWEAIE